MVEQERFEQVKKNIERMWFDRSPFVPQDFAGWIDFRATSAAAEAEDRKARLAEKEAQCKAGLGKSVHSIALPFDGRIFNDNRSAVLAQHTIWSPWSQPTEFQPFAPWPTKDEMKEEGDERHTSGFGRFLAVPRVPGNETVAYKQKAFLPVYPMDHVCPVPTLGWTLTHEIFENAEDLAETCVSYEVSGEEKEIEDQLTLMGKEDTDDSAEIINGTNVWEVHAQQIVPAEETEANTVQDKSEVRDTIVRCGFESEVTRNDPNRLDDLDQVNLASVLGEYQTDLEKEEFKAKDLTTSLSDKLCKSWEEQQGFLEAYQDI